ncbi:Type III secretion outermembrane pore forming protein (YscC,MxiD,HrcC, InvG) [Pseudomonas synxantha]|uniref:Type III secretion outermembrane pore forming protein (YscC,MxiD,HrcC, InvG) n=1 Tax=Pseudomonas synxantha TaxID=47883 RepID=A0A3G7UBZ5_9PSED|nr:type III secretion system outer membrane ring subunit SctC [Pseudomonas synxantha]AZE56885.1 Type III secretion outermembrane pore forming protein (YscC,MxiD,HrcC, InvG) [Pseudomonas synxantha]
MLSIRSGRHAATLCALLLSLSYALPVTAIEAPEWQLTAYAYDAHEEPLVQVLGRLAEAFGFALELTGDYAVVSGRYRSDRAVRILERLALEHRFNWLFYNNTLYVSPAGPYESVRLDVKGNIGELHQALMEIGLLDPRYGWGPLERENSVLVSGPQLYVALVEAFVREQLPPVKEESAEVELISLPLRYINSDDRSVQYRTQKVLIPGAASLLRKLLVGGRVGADLSMAGLGLDTSDSATSSVAKLLPAPERRDTEPDRAPAGGIRVEADIRNNMVLVHDRANRRPMYERLIALLDQPSRLIEIDALILDISRHDLSSLATDWQMGNGSIMGGVSLLPAGATSTFNIGNLKRFMAQVKALEGSGRAALIANPSVLTLENHPAIIDFSRTEYLSTVGERVANLDAVTVGTSLQVTPRSINTDQRRQIQLLIDIEDGEFEPGSEGAVLSRTHKSTISTQVLIEENRALVVGGLQQQQRRDSTRQIPLLGKIPLLGPLLFTDREQSQSGRERVFILIPRLVGDQLDPRGYLPEEERPVLQQALERVRTRKESEGLLKFIDLRGTR